VSGGVAASCSCGGVSDPATLLTDRSPLWVYGELEERGDLSVGRVTWSGDHATTSGVARSPGQHEGEGAEFRQHVGAVLDGPGLVGEHEGDRAAVEHIMEVAPASPAGLLAGTPDGEVLPAQRALDRACGGLGHPPGGVWREAKNPT
jgi:hypothetical protein